MYVLYVRQQKGDGANVVRKYAKPNTEKRQLLRHEDWPQSRHQQSYLGSASASITQSKSRKGDGPIDAVWKYRQRRKRQKNPKKSSEKAANVNGSSMQTHPKNKGRKKRLKMWITVLQTNFHFVNGEAFIACTLETASHDIQFWAEEDERRL
jgi:hypothetical protein